MSSASALSRVGAFVRRRPAVVAVVSLTVLAGVLVAVPEARTAGDESAPPSAEVVGYPVDPYVDPAQMREPRDLSFYAQPWRGYLETVPGTAFLEGLGVHYPMPSGTDHDAALGALAGAGFSTIRFEFSWAQMTVDGTIEPDAKERLETLLEACDEHGITPVILLNANHGFPGPSTATTHVVVSGGAAGSRELVLDTVDGLVAGKSGLSDVTGSGWMAEVLFDTVNAATGAVTLSKPLPEAIPDGTVVDVHTLEYLPLYPVGTPEFEETMAGWLQYTAAVAEVAAAKVDRFEFEVWNELSFGSKFLSINNYYDPPIVTFPTEQPTDPGGQAWEMARRTVEQVDVTHPDTRVVWGFSNTTFFATAIEDLPPGIDAQSYHPYKTGHAAIPQDFPTEAERRLFRDGFIPRAEMVMPEGRAHLGVTVQRLPRLLTPEARLSSRPPETTRFFHYMTEHGFSPFEAGVRDGEQADQLRARALLRATLFWLNKGITRLEVSSAWKQEPLGNGLLPASIHPNEFGDVEPEALESPALRAMGNVAAQFEGSVPIDEHRELGVEVTSVGDQPIALEGLGGHDPLYYRDLFTVLPFQVAPDKFVVAVYVMGYNLLAPPPEMDFLVTLTGVNGSAASVTYYDPLTDREVPVRDVVGEADQLSLGLTATDYPRLLVIQE